MVPEDEDAAAVVHLGSWRVAEHRAAPRAEARLPFGLKMPDPTDSRPRKQAKRDEKRCGGAGDLSTQHHSFIKPFYVEWNKYFDEKR